MRLGEIQLPLPTAVALLPTRRHAAVAIVTKIYLWMSQKSCSLPQ